jgi:hypothetical protein
MSTVAKVLSTAIVDRGLVEVETIVGRRLRSVITASRVTSLVCKGSCVSSHLASVVVVARRSWRRISLERRKTGWPQPWTRIELRHTLRRLWPIVESALGILGWADKHRVVGMSLDVLLQILGSLERLAAELTLVRLQRNVDTDVWGDVVSLDRGSSARVPLTSQVEVVCALATNMALTDVLVESLRSRELLVTSVPSADKVVIVWCWCSTAAALGGVGWRAGRRSDRLGVIASTARWRLSWWGLLLLLLLLLLLKLRLLLRDWRRHDGREYVISGWARSVYARWRVKSDWLAETSQAGTTGLDSSLKIRTN